VDVKFHIHIQLSISIIHRFYVDIHGYIHIHRCISCIFISTEYPQSTHSDLSICRWTAAYTGLSQCSHTRNGSNLFSISTKMAFACTSYLFRFSLTGIGAYVTFFSNNQRKSSKHQQSAITRSVPNTKHVQSRQHMLQTHRPASISTTLRLSASSAFSAQRANPRSN